MITVVGIDPGLAATGVGIVRGDGRRVTGYSFGSIQTSKNTTLPARLDKIFSKLLKLLKEERPDVMVVEDIFSLGRYPQSGITLGKVVGIVLLAACHSGVRCMEIPVREAKQVLTGNGNAGKEQLEEAVRHRLKHNTPIRPYHASDAIGLALIGFYRCAGAQRNNRV